MTETAFPLDSFKDAAIVLRRPFTPAAVKFKVQATFGKPTLTGGLIVGYIDARLVVERLNLIVPHLWHDAYEPAGKNLLCRLTVDNITRWDVGEGVGKGLYSDALKRAGVKFGVGVSLYAIPKTILNVKDGHLKAYKDTLMMTPAGEARARELYAGWLTAHGAKAFGDPLDHGDADGAQGDPEEAPVVPVDETLSVEDRAKLREAADSAGMGPAELANIVKVVAGGEPTLFETEDDGEKWLGRWLPDMAAAIVDPVLESIAASAGVAA